MIVATNFQTLLEKKIQLTREELAKLNDEQQSANDDENIALNIICRMSFAALGDTTQRALILKEFKAVAEEG